MQSRTKSILRYPGSKARFAPFIAETLRLNVCDGGLFAEPFCGGASVSIALLEAGVVDSIAINDADPLIASLWKCVFNEEDAKWLAQEIATIPLTLEEWVRQRDLKPSSDREKALKCLYLNRTSFNGIIYRAGPIGGWAQKNRTLGVRFNRENLARRVIELSRLSAYVEVFNHDWRYFCGNEMAKRQNVFYYLDPPYFHKAEKLYGYVFDDSEHRALRDFLLNSPKLSWLLSYDDAAEIRLLYGDSGLMARSVDNTYSTHPLGGNSFVGRELIYSSLIRLPTPDSAGTPHCGITVHESRKFPGLTDTPLKAPHSVQACELMAA